MKKKANELKPGDVFWIQQEMLMYLAALGPDLGNDGVHCYVLNAPPKGSLTTRYLGGTDGYKTEAPQNLTPAQQHADELLELARKVASMRSPSSAATSVIVKAGELLDKINPAIPPTLEEALYALDLMTNKLRVDGLSGQRATAQEILERARRSGVLK